MKYLLILLFIFSFNGLAEIRYVSKTGSSTVPYTSWATACDSIQKCIKISSSGDTIYVANGSYAERVKMIPGLTLIGSGMDSCIIDGRTLDYDSLNYVLKFNSDCILSGFCFLSSNFQHVGIEGDFQNYLRKSFIENNKFLDFRYAIFLEDITQNLSINTIIRENIIIGDGGIWLTFTYVTVENNYFMGKFTNSCLCMGLGNRSLIKNNILVCGNTNTSLYSGTFSYGNKIFNNVFLGVYKYLFTNFVVSLGGSDTLVNNFIYGGYSGVHSLNPQRIVNNIITGCTGSGLGLMQIPGRTGYNAVWDAAGIGIADTTNMFVLPMVVDVLTDQHLQKYSPLIDAGDPTILDVDGTRSDIGPYGGPFGESYDYRDLSPDIPKGLTAEKDSLGVRIKWKKNYETDFKQFLLYRDTIENFTPSESNLAGNFTDTTYAHSAPYYPIKYYYKIKSEDNQGNISQASEQIAIVLTDLNEENPQVIQDYILYQNYPNPFNPNTIISYRLKEQGYVKLYIYDMKGELVSTLVNEVQPAGYYEREFSGKAATDISDLASGVYIYRIEVIGSNNFPVFSEMKKMILLK